MELELNRVDYLQVDVNSRKCTRLLPAAEPKACQKVVVANEAGVVHCFGIKKGEVQTIFKTLPGAKVTRIQLGGSIGSVQDKIFVSAGSEVYGVTKKGKQFLRFDTNITDTITSMCVCGNNLMVCSDYVYNHYLDCQDTNYYLCSDKINDMIVLPLTKVKSLIPVLACQDRVVRVLKDSKCQLEIEVPGPASALALYQNDGGASGTEILYGTSDGQLGLISIENMKVTKVWELENTEQQGGITCMDSYDIMGDGVKDLIVGRNDGEVQVYICNDTEMPVLRFSYNCGESITSVQGGVVGNAGYDEILVTTYSGKVFGLSSENLEKRLDPNYLLISPEAAQKIFKLREEVEELEQKVARERENYQQSTYSEKGTLSAVPYFNINDSFVLNHNDASYTLSIEVQTAIDVVMLQSNVPVDLLESEKNSAVVSYSPCDPENGNYLLVTYRCQANTSRLEVKVRSIEGQFGSLKAYITPRLQPKCCQVRDYRIKPLSLHRRTHTADDSVPLNVLKLNGSFSLGEMHSWIVLSLPEVAEKTVTEDSVSVYFVSAFLGTVLHCYYRKGEAVFKSDNISTISILKDVLTKEATRKKISLDISCDINDDSIEHVLKLIHPKLEYQLILAKKVQLIDALKELSVHEGNTDFLAPEYKGILEDAEQLQKEFKRQPCHLERLYGMITDLYIDVYKFKGVSVKSKVPQLLQILDNYDPDSLIEFFQSKV
ncbi:Bardet-Biedl syndrome 7 protein homolog [Ornithodoros turicata]|uniref:Bardet-Biedl syndrome 7 protein homolog n=1 Tax=Ornithodoros turicata TaxID=34597 RepID=UPI0031398671